MKTAGGRDGADANLAVSTFEGGDGAVVDIVDDDIAGVVGLKG